MGLSKESKKKLIQQLEPGDLIMLGKSPRLIRKIKLRDGRGGSEYVGKKYYFYFAKKNISAYSAAYTLYTHSDMLHLFNGLIKRNVPLFKSDEEARLQYAIEADLSGNMDFEKNKKAKQYGMYVSQYEVVGKFK